MNTFFILVYTQISNKLTLAHQKIQLNMQGHIGAIQDNQPHGNYVFFHLNADVTSTQYVTTCLLYTSDAADE